MVVRFAYLFSEDDRGFFASDWLARRKRRYLPLPSFEKRLASGSGSVGDKQVLTEQFSEESSGKQNGIKECE